eukprot:s474_g2.t1
MPLVHVVDQLLDESNHGRVWITNWPGRYQSKLGQLREFLERHPDKFTVIPQSGRRYVVAFADRNAAGAAAKSKAAKEKGGKGKAAPKKLEWKRTEKQDGDGDTAGVPRKLEVWVHQLSGDLLCQLQVEDECTVELLKHHIQSLTDIPQTRPGFSQGKLHQTWQHLMNGGAAPLAEGAKVAENATKDGRVELQIVQSFKPAMADVPLPRDEMVLRKAICEKDVDLTLGLLTLDELPGGRMQRRERQKKEDQRRESQKKEDQRRERQKKEDQRARKGLNEKDACCGCRGRVCQCILERKDFTEANAHDISGLTALHCAACRGHLGAVLVLLATSSFTVVDSADAQIDRNGVGWSARDIAEPWHGFEPWGNCWDWGNKQPLTAILGYLGYQGTDASEKPSRSVRRSDEDDPDATAFDAEGAEGEAGEADAADGAEAVEEGGAEGAEGDEEVKLGEVFDGLGGPLRPGSEITLHTGQQEKEKAAGEQKMGRYVNMLGATLITSC